MKYTYMFETDEEITGCLNCPINQDICEKDFCPISDDSNYVFPSFEKCPLLRVVNGIYKVKLGAVSEK